MFRYSDVYRFIIHYVAALLLIESDLELTCNVSNMNIIEVILINLIIYIDIWSNCTCRR